jgi:hypothetical protein
MGIYCVPIAPGPRRVPQLERKKEEMETILPPETLVLARRLVAHEADAGKDSVATEAPAFRVYEKLRRHLCELTGVAGFQSLASRALTLARVEAPSLNAVQVIADGSIRGLGEAQPQIDKDDGGTILIAQLLGLLLIFIGEALTLQLLQDVWPKGKHELTR